MSEFQYYEFLAVDRPLDAAAQKALRSISSRARITARSFVNHYEWGDLKGDPNRFMEQWFDLHLYFANWGARRLMMRVPAQLLAEGDLDGFIGGVDWAGVRTFGEDVIVDLYYGGEGEEPLYWDDDGSGWLADLAPLRADVLSGDLRLFYLVWLSSVRDEADDGEADDADDEEADDQPAPDEALEPLPGIGPLTPALEAFAEFFCIDGDLLRAAAEAGPVAPPAPEGGLRAAIAGIGEPEKTELLLRVVDGDPHVAAELRRRFRPTAGSAPLRTAGDLRRRATEIGQARERAAAEAREAGRRREAEKKEQARRERIAALKARGDAVWDEVESEIARRNPTGYDRAASLLFDLEALAVEEGGEAFRRRLSSIRQRHASKGRFIERLAGLRGHGLL